MNRFFRTVPARGKCSVSTLCASYFNKFFYIPRLRIALYVSTLGTRNFLTTPIEFLSSIVCVLVLSLFQSPNPFCIVAYESDNYSSATCPDFKPEMDSLFTKELTLECISMVQSKLRCVHPIGRVPKKDSGKSHPITDCSRPHGISLNDHIKRDLQFFCMNSIDSAVSFSTSYCFYSIVDMESAWRWIPVFPPHRELQGFRWSLAHTTLPSIIITWTTDFVLRIVHFQPYL